MTPSHNVEGRQLWPYPAYRDTGVEWLGEIPAHWHALSLKRVCRLSYGESLAADDRVDGDSVVFGSNGPVGTHNRTNTEAPCLIVGRKGSFGKVNYSADAVFAIDTTFVVDERHTEADLRWLFYTLQWARLDRASKDSAIPGLDREDAYAFVTAVGPIDEQREIASFLDRETAKLDALIAKKERLIKLLQEKRTALITRAVTRGLDSSVRMKDSGVEWLGTIPCHWEVKRLRHVVHHIEQGWSPSCENREAETDEWGVLKAGCVNRGTFVESEHKALPSMLSPIPALEIRSGDLLMSRASGSRDLIGSVAVVPQCRPRLLLCDKVFRLHTEADAEFRRFIGYAMNSRMVRWQIESVVSGGSGLASNISQEAVKDLIVVLPTRTERQKIARYLDWETGMIDALIAKVQDATDLLTEYRTALISAAVTGKIDVRQAAA